VLLGTHWEPRERIGNLIVSHWELERNMLGTKEKWKKSLGPPAAQNIKGKNQAL
jgi:hypothetical protein